MLTSAARLQDALKDSTEGFLLDGLVEVHARLARVLQDNGHTVDRAPVLAAARAAVQYLMSQ